jgi:hypothetical protein
MQSKLKKTFSNLSSSIAVKREITPVLFELRLHEPAERQ